MRRTSLPKSKNRKLPISRNHVSDCQATNMADLWGEDGEQEEEDMQEEEEEDILDMGEEALVQQEGVLLMRFCPNDSSMLYPQVCMCHLLSDVHVHCLLSVSPFFQFVNKTGRQTEQNPTIRLSTMSVHGTSARPAFSLPK